MHARWRAAGTGCLQAAQGRRGHGDSCGEAHGRGPCAQAARTLAAGASRSPARAATACRPTQIDGPLLCILKAMFEVREIMYIDEATKILQMFTSRTLSVETVRRAVKLLRLTRKVVRRADACRGLPSSAARNAAEHMPCVGAHAASPAPVASGSRPPPSPEATGRTCRLFRPSPATPTPHATPLLVCACSA